MDANDRPAEPQKVRVTIFNQAYTLVTTGDPSETEALARRVDDLMYQISRGGNLDSTRTAVLAALHLADELRAIESSYATQQRQMASMSKELGRLLDETHHANE